MSHPHRSRLGDPDGLTPRERREALEHARSCADCRRVLVGDEPGRLFALLGVDSLPESALERLSDRVESAIGPARAARPHGWRAASLAASLLLGVVFGGYLVTARRDEPAAEGRRVAAERAPAVPEAMWRVPPGTALPPEPVRGVELISSPGTGRVVNLAVGQTRVVMIFDEELDI
jgi:hypothetical protein